MQIHQTIFSLACFIVGSLGAGSAFGAVQINPSQEKSAEIVTIHYDLNLMDEQIRQMAYYETEPYKHKWTDDLVWDRAKPGHWNSDHCFGKSADQYFLWTDTAWDDTGEGESLDGGIRGQNVCGTKDGGDIWDYTVTDGWPGENCNIKGARVRYDGSRVWDDTRKRTALTLYELRTGGKAKSKRQSLFVLSGGAQGIRSGFWPEADSDPDAYDIPFGQITLGSVGKLGNDARIYKMLPDNQTYNVTPTVAGNQYYVYGTPGLSQHKPYLTANGVRLDPAKVNTTNCVGQKMVFALGFEPTGPEGVQTINYRWLLSGKYVNAWEEYSGMTFNNYLMIVCHPATNWVTRAHFGTAPATPYCKFYKTLDWPLTQSETGAWWVSGGGKSASCNAELTFTNGQKVTVVATGKFQMYRPSVANFTPLNNNMYWDPPTLQGIMNFSITLNSDYDGLFGITQLINGTTFYFNTHGEDYLDGNSEIYGEPGGGPQTYSLSHTTELLDTPNAPGTPCVDLEATFKDYLRFKPGVTENDGNIFVTIAKNGWYMDGTACLATGMTKSNLPPATAPVDMDEFPVWTNARPE